MSYEGTIKIVEEDMKFFEFKITQEFFNEIENRINQNPDYFFTCSSCDGYLNISYVYIITTLKEKGLLPENFKPICCICRNL